MGYSLYHLSSSEGARHLEYTTNIWVAETLAWVHLLNSESAAKSSEILEMQRQKNEKHYKRLEVPMPSVQVR
jgi:hypothetical protein